MTCSQLFKDYFTMCKETRFRINEIYDIQADEYPFGWRSGMKDSEQLADKKRMYNDHMKLKDIMHHTLQKQCPTMYD